MSDAQNTKVLEALRQGPMTALDAFQRFGVLRMSARVFDLRQAGYDIRSRQVAVTNRDGQTCRVAQYTLGGAQRSLVPEHPGRGCVTDRAQVRA